MLCAQVEQRSARGGLAWRGCRCRGTRSPSPRECRSAARHAGHLFKQRSHLRLARLAFRRPLARQDHLADGHGGLAHEVPLGARLGLLVRLRLGSRLLRSARRLLWCSLRAGCRPHAAARVAAARSDCSPSHTAAGRLRTGAPISGRTARSCARRARRPLSPRCAGSSHTVAPPLDEAPAASRTPARLCARRLGCCPQWRMAAALPGGDRDAQLEALQRRTAITPFTSSHTECVGVWRRSSVGSCGALGAAPEAAVTARRSTVVARRRVT